MTSRIPREYRRKLAKGYWTVTTEVMMEGLYLRCGTLQGVKLPC